MTLLPAHSEIATRTQIEIEAEKREKIVVFFSGWLVSPPPWVGCLRAVGNLLLVVCCQPRTYTAGMFEFLFIAGCVLSSAHCWEVFRIVVDDY